MRFIGTLNQDGDINVYPISGRRYQKCLLARLHGDKTIDDIFHPFESDSKDAAIAFITEKLNRNGKKAFFACLHENGWVQTRQLRNEDQLTREYLSGKWVRVSMPFYAVDVIEASEIIRKRWNIANWQDKLEMMTMAMRTA